MKFPQKRCAGAYPSFEGTIFICGGVSPPIMGAANQEARTTTSKFGDFFFPFLP